MRPLFFTTFFVVAIFLFYSCEKSNSCEKNNSSEQSQESEKIKKTELSIIAPEWNTITKSYGKGLTKPDWIIGDKVTIFDGDCEAHTFTVIDTSSMTAVIQSLEYELVDGKKYRIIYPEAYTDSHNGINIGLGFGGYTSSESTDFFYSDYFTYDSSTQLEPIELKRINAILDLNITSPVDGRIIGIKVSSDNQPFCIKGYFDFVSDNPKPILEATSWENEWYVNTNHSYDYKTPDLEVVQAGIPFNIQSTVYPSDFSDSNITITLEFEDGSIITAETFLPKVEAGNSYVINLSDFDYSVPPIQIKSWEFVNITGSSATARINVLVNSDITTHIYAGVTDIREFNTVNEKLSLSLVSYVENKAGSMFFGTWAYDYLTYSLSEITKARRYDNISIGKEITCEIPVYGLSPDTEYTFVPIVCACATDGDFAYGIGTAYPSTQSFKTSAQRVSDGSFYKKVTEDLSDWTGEYLIVYDKGAYATVNQGCLVKSTDITFSEEGTIPYSDNLMAATVLIDQGVTESHAGIVDGVWYYFCEGYSILLPSGNYLAYVPDKEGNLNYYDTQYACSEDSCPCMFGNLSIKDGIHFKTEYNEDIYLRYQTSNNSYLFMRESPFFNLPTPDFYRLEQSTCVNPL